jgi:hypothetical protein
LLPQGLIASAVNTALIEKNHNKRSACPLGKNGKRGPENGK